MEGSPHSSSLRLHNTLTRRVEAFVPREQGRVGMYVCGPTVQGPPHFGHARGAIVTDVLRRHLEWSGYRVLHVRNITDVEDKIIARAEAEGRTAAEVAEDYARVWESQIGALGVLPPHIVPRATGHILEMIELIEELIEAGAAYEAAGDVLFRVRAFEGYGKLSGRRVDELRAGARVEPDERKEDPLDFALWKAAKPDEPSWPSPWGRGRPGWHIECSAMAAKYLGQGFDLHAGGIDLVFPHHENEVAQSEAATGAPFVRHWLHHGLLNLGAEKMSKSVGNIISLGEALERYGPTVLRHFYLGAHYRSPVEFSEERLDEARAAFDRWAAFVRATAGLRGAGAAADADPAEAQQARRAFRAALDEDLNTPQAHAVLFALVSAGNRHLEMGRRAEAARLAEVLVELAGVLGYGFAPAQADRAGLLGALVEELLRLRAQARERRDFATADDIRARLAGLGVVVEDSPEGALWHLS
ncbi:MAG TPA: cysteine--tRNA ligase [Egibacteraceae bacterium]|jgi:cysteinyl-tRNA synthetase|nr:cysteine--tRNA ligase [Egibacteraceae bacterium]